MKNDLQYALPYKPTVSPSTIARTLDGMLMTIKLAEDVPDARNSSGVLDMRIKSAQWFLEHGLVAHCVHIDETGHNIWTRHSFGRAPHGVLGHVHGQRGWNCNITVAVSGEIGLIHHRKAFETITRERFEEFLADTAHECENVTCR